MACGLISSKAAKIVLARTEGGTFDEKRCTTGNSETEHDRHPAARERSSALSRAGPREVTERALKGYAPIPGRGSQCDDGRALAHYSCSRGAARSPYALRTTPLTPRALDLASSPI